MNYLLLLYILVIPFFGKSLNYLESIIFFGLPPLLFFLCLTLKTKLKPLPNSFIYWQIALIFLFLISTIFSKNIGNSYYAFFQFITLLFVVDLALMLWHTFHFPLLTLTLTGAFYASLLILNKTGILPLSVKDGGDNFILQVFGHSYSADFFVLAFFPSLYLTLNRSKKYIFLFLLICVGLILAQSRSALVAVTFGLFFFAPPLQYKKIKIPIITVFIAIIICFFVTISRNHQSTKTLTGSRLEYWQQAFNYFLDSPIIGNGANTFTLANKRYQTVPYTNTNLSHSSLLTYLSENGLIFTFVFYGFYSYCLYRLFFKNRLFFTIAATSLVDSLLDPSWQSPGILIITLIFLFLDNLSTPKTTHSHFSTLLSTIIFLFFLSKTSSDVLYFLGRSRLSLIVDPFNSNALIELIDQTPITDPYWPSLESRANALFANKYEINYQLSQKIPLPQSETYYLKLAYLNPKEINTTFMPLFLYYYQTQNYVHAQNLIKAIVKNDPVAIATFADRIAISQCLYLTGVATFSHSPSDSLWFFQNAINYIPTLGHYHIDLANAYWHLGQQSLAINQLQNICQHSPGPEQQCQEYLASHQAQNFDLPGSADFVEYVTHQLKP